MLLYNNIYTTMSVFVWRWTCSHIIRTMKHWQIGVFGIYISLRFYAWYLNFIFGASRPHKIHRFIPHLLSLNSRYYFGCLGHAWARPRKPIVLTCIKRCFSTCKNSTSPLFFLEILHLQESCNLIGWEHFGP